jgi:hypothetical protein
MIAAVAAAAALATPSREALVLRWLAAGRTHAAVSLQSSARRPPAPANLQALARRELGIPGRYRLTEGPVPPAQQSLWLRFWHWLGERWDRLWNALSKRVHVSKRTANGIGWAVLAGVALVFLWVVARLLSNVRLVRSRRRVNAEPLGSRPEPAALYREAHEAANRGEYGRAALVLFAATVVLLDGRGAVAVERSATVGDLRRALRSKNASLVAPFDAVAGPFVRTAYAERAVDASQWERADRGDWQIGSALHAAER